MFTFTRPSKTFPNLDFWFQNKPSGNPGVTFEPQDRGQSYDFGMYNYDASVVIGQGVFQGKVKYFCIQIALGYSWRCKFLQRRRCNSQAYVGLAPDLIR
jgi:hypothetical protein